MELETLFTRSKWEIIKRISQEKESPLQIAENLNTTVANVSQQLKLLEMANLIKKERLPNRASGKPRTLFSIKDDFAYLITCTKEGVQKKLISLGLYQKIILNSFLAENQELHRIASDLYYELEGSMESVNAILFNQKNRKELYIIGEKASELQRRCERITKKVDTELLEIRFFTEREFLRNLPKICIASKDDILGIYDVNNIIGNLQKKEVVK